MPATTRSSITIVSFSRTSRARVSDAHRRAGVLRREPRLLAGLDRRILRPLLPEVRECALQVPKGLLQRHAGDIVEERVLLLLLPAGQQRGALHVVNPAL